MKKGYTKKEKNQIASLAKGKKPRGLRLLHKNAAGVDISPKFHVVAVEEGSSPDGEDVKIFGPTTDQLLELAKWLKACKVETVAMESTGVYWIPMREILEAQGFEVVLVHAPHYRNVPGKKTDINDAQWLQTLHSYGLLRGCYRPSNEVLPVRTYVRERGSLVRAASRQKLKMQKALDQMNVLVHRAVSDISGETGMRIIRAIVKGERDVRVLAEFRDERCKKSVAEIMQALQGNFLDQHLFSLRQALNHYDFIQAQIVECDQEIEKALEALIPQEWISKPCDEVEEELIKKFRPRKGEPDFNAALMAKKILGIDITAIPGISARTTLVWLAEIGWDMSPWATCDHFTSWLALCPGSNKSGGVQHSGRTRKSSNRLAQALRQAASTLKKNQGPLGEYLRRKKAHLGPAKAITATAHKLARILYRMVTEAQPYNEDLVKDQNGQRKRRQLKSLIRRAEALGMKVVPQEAERPEPQRDVPTEQPAA